MHDVGIELSQVFVLRARDDGVHEETSCIALNLWVGQLRTTDVDDDLSQLFCRKLLDGDVAALQFGTNASVVEARSEMCAKAICDIQHSPPTTLCVSFENTVPIAVLAFLTGECAPFAILQVHAFNVDDEVLCFGSVGSDVLNG